MKNNNRYISIVKIFLLIKKYEKYIKNYFNIVIRK